MGRGMNRVALWGALGLGAACAIRQAVRSRRFFPLRGRVALITGGSRGLGLVLARRLLDEGCSVAICARDQAELDAAGRDLAAHATLESRILTVPCDVTDRTQVAALFQRIRDELGDVDLLINNAGVIAMGPQQEMTVEDYDLAMRVHFWASLYCTLEALPAMRRRRSGRIVNIASIGGKVPVPHLAPYCASKFALVGLSGALRPEAARDNVFITTVCPGLMRTGSHVNATFKGQHEREYAWFKWMGLTGAVAAEHAAERIIRAAQRGDAEVVIGLTALAAARFHNLAPEWASDALTLANRLLPGPGGIGRSYAKGRESESRRTRSRLMRPMEQAAMRNNEMPDVSPTTEDARA